MVLESGLLASIDEAKISDQWTRVPTDEYSNPRIPISEGQVIWMRTCMHAHAHAHAYSRAFRFEGHVIWMHTHAQPSL